MSTDTRATVKALHEAYRAGDGERVAALVHDDIDWCIYGPARIFSFEGPRHGKEQVLEVLAAIGGQFELKRYEPEIVICDIGLPEMDGYAVARALRSDERSKGSYLVALSGYGREDDVRQALAAGFDRHRDLAHLLVARQPIHPRGRSRHRVM